MSLLGLLVNLFILEPTLCASENQTRISETELRELAKALAPKVALFAEIWKQDPNAILFAGTSRDFIYWILRKLNTAKSRSELNQKIESLLEIPSIDIREIVGGESDIDVISEQSLNIHKKTYGVRKIDVIDALRLDPETDTGRTELEQGYIPAEKIQLSSDGLKTPEQFGNGVHEILTGKLSAHFVDEKTFWNSHYAKQNLNHPVFLAVRFIRLLAADWFNKYGRSFPDDELLNFDSEIKKRIRKIFEEAITDPKFENVLKNRKALNWLNSSLLKSFRSYTSPTATYKLLEHLGFKKLQAAYPEIEPINQFLFIKHYDPEQIRRNFEEFKTDASKTLIPASDLISDLKLAHGTKTEENFRVILFQNVQPSEAGSAGAGLYSVNLDNLEFAETWGGSADRVVIFDISRDAKIIDLTEGAGEKLFKKWAEKNGDDYDRFADDFGADILRYPYTPKAFVIKNSQVLVGRRGLNRDLVSTSQVRNIISNIKTIEDIRALVKILNLNAFSTSEVQTLLRRLTLSPSLLAETLSLIRLSEDENELNLLMSIAVGSSTTETQTEQMLNEWRLKTLGSRNDEDASAKFFRDPVFNQAVRNKLKEFPQTKNLNLEFHRLGFEIFNFESNENDRTEALIRYFNQYFELDHSLGQFLELANLIGIYRGSPANTQLKVYILEKIYKKFKHQENHRAIFSKIFSYPHCKEDVNESHQFCWPRYNTSFWQRSWLDGFLIFLSDLDDSELIQNLVDEINGPNDQSYVLSTISKTLDYPLIADHLRFNEFIYKHFDIESRATKELAKYDIGHATEIFLKTSPTPWVFKTRFESVEYSYYKVMDQSEPHRTIEAGLGLRAELRNALKRFGQRSERDLEFFFITAAQKLSELNPRELKERIEAFIGLNPSIDQVDSILMRLHYDEKVYPGMFSDLQSTHSTLTTLLRYMRRTALSDKQFFESVYRLRPRKYTIEDMSEFLKREAGFIKLVSQAEESEAESDPKKKRMSYNTYLVNKHNKVLKRQTCVYRIKEFFDRFF